MKRSTVPSHRTFLSLTAGSLALSRLAAQQSPLRVALYANVGPELLHYDVDVANAMLAKRGSITLPASIQYGWPHENRRYLYVASSDFFNNAKSKQNYVTALYIDPKTGELSEHGESVRLPARPIHITTDIPSEYVLVTFNSPSGVRVYQASIPKLA